MYGEGISREGDLLDLAVNHNVVEKAARGSRTKASVSARAATTSRTCSKRNTDLLERIEAGRESRTRLCQKPRQRAGLKLLHTQM